MDRTRENMEEAAANAAQAASEATASAAQTASESLDQGKQALSEMQAVLTDRTRECVQTTEMYVRENPWQAVGIAAAAGLVIGLLMGRR
jgi:ElaB/YqjD/DUF883 family membrane-anchored ribosome-binding protein